MSNARLKTHSACEQIDMPWLFIILHTLDFVLKLFNLLLWFIILVYHSIPRSVVFILQLFSRFGGGSVTKCCLHTVSYTNNQIITVTKLNYSSPGLGENLVFTNLHNMKICSIGLSLSFQASFLTCSS